MKLFTKIKLKNRDFIWLALFLLMGLLWRVYNYDKAFLFAHDQDLYSWIAKDIVVNKHLRMVGQITSVDGVFIGPLYYYVMAMSYWLFGMNPLSAVLPTTIIGLATIISFYILGRKYFSRRIGLVMAFAYAISFGAAWYDRWSVPTEPAILWTVWFIYVILGMYRKNLKLLPLYGLLAALTYHIHIALVPILPIPIVAYFISGESFGDNLKKIKIKQLIVAILIFIVVSSPFWVFEIRHNFSQIKSVIVASKKDMGNPTGWPKLVKVINASSIEMQQRLFIGWSIKPLWLVWVVWLLMTLLVFKFKKIKGRELGLLGLWILLIGWAQFGSKRIVSEYYFTNYLAIFVIIIALFLDLFWKHKNLKVVILGGGILYLIINLKWMNKITNQIDDSYYYRKQLVEFIKTDQEKNAYPCIGIN